MAGGPTEAAPESSITCVDQRLSLLEKYSISGPRYTSYPTAPVFTKAFGETEYRAALAQGSGPLSLYIHLPFCRHVCWFCACSVIYTNNQARVGPYLDLLAREADLLLSSVDRARPVSQLHYGGGTPTFLTPEEVRRLGVTLSERFHFAPDAEKSIELDPRTATQDHLDALAEFGFNRASLGVQDFAPEVQAAVNRVQPYAQTAELLAELRKRGYRELNVDLIYGLPHQTPEGFAETLTQILGLRPDRVSLFHFAYLPDLKKHQRNINANDLPDTRTRIVLFEQALDLLVRGGYVHIGMDHFALPESGLVRAQKEHRLHRNFQGYVSNGDPDLIGLGVTSIGRPAPNAFAQNVKGIKEYRELLGAGRLPLDRGMVLSANDMLRGHIIQEIICHFALNFRTVGQHWNLDFASVFAAELLELKSFVEDGLLELHEHGLVVTEKGRFVVRNICMVFDAYLKAQRQRGSAFSRTV